MEINVEKCGIMTIPPTSQKYKLKIENAIVPQVKEYTYLGIQLNEELDIEKMANYRVPKGNHILDLIWKTITAKRIPTAYKML